MPELTKDQLKKKIGNLESEIIRLSAALKAYQEEAKEEIPAEDKEILLRMKDKTQAVRRDGLNFCAKCGAWQSGYTSPHYCHFCGRPYREVEQTTAQADGLP